MAFELTEKTLKDLTNNLIKLYLAKKAINFWFSSLIYEKYSIKKELGIEGATRSLTGEILKGLENIQKIFKEYFHSRTSNLILDHIKDEIDLIKSSPSKLEELEDLSPIEGFSGPKEKFAHENKVKEITSHLNLTFNLIKGNKVLYTKFLKEDILNETNSIISQLEKLEIKPEEIINILETLNAEKPILEGLKTQGDIITLAKFLDSEEKEIKKIRGNEIAIIAKALQIK